MGKVTKIPQKLHSSRLSRIFPRVARENSNLSYEHITEGMAPFCPPQSADSACVVAKENPFDNYELVHEVDLQDTIPYFNSLLLYRILKLLYDRPDILGAVFGISGGAGSEPIFKAALDWGYTIEITDDLFAEVRSIHNNTRFKLRYWINESRRNEVKKKHGEKMEEFFKEFSDCVEENARLFEEREEIKDKAKSMSAFSNVFAEKYNSAMQIFSMAQNIDHLPEKKDIAWEERIAVNTAGSLFLSSAILFIIALETLINTIYHLLLRPDFDHEPYRRATIKADLDLRIISAHLFCDGFAKSILTPGTDLWNRVLKLRNFRNNVFHGNITPEHYVYILPEDMFAFFYGGITDFRGRIAEEKATKDYPTTMPQVNIAVVSEIKETVDQTIAAITEAADQENRAWLSSWLWEAMIPRFDKKKG